MYFEYIFPPLGILEILPTLLPSQLTFFPSQKKKRQKKNFKKQ